MNTWYQSRNGFSSSSLLPMPSPGSGSSGSALGSKMASAMPQVAAFQHAPPPSNTIASLLTVPPRTKKWNSSPRAQMVSPPGSILVQLRSRSGSITSLPLPAAPPPASLPGLVPASSCVPGVEPGLSSSSPQAISSTAAQQSRVEDKRMA